MNHKISVSNLDKTISTEQFERVMAAILAGKYSWACVLILQFAGYNPLCYIPYRTYNRLLKENPLVERSGEYQHEGTVSHSSNMPDPEVSLSLNNIKDIPYLEVVGKQKAEVRGGNFEYYLQDKFSKYTAAVELGLNTKNKPKFSLVFFKFP
ncbi:MAG: HetP family heterocyst commitment protein [Nostocaceae cyanobacterium]|nr:HetP family heterocyst commitment protein [Nostocaceae cyanobacterium]